MTLGRREEALLSGGPHTTQNLHYPDRVEVVGAPERQELLTNLARHVAKFAAEAPVWPGDGLVTPPATPARMPYQPFQYQR